LLWTIYILAAAAEIGGVATAASTLKRDTDDVPYFEWPSRRRTVTTGGLILGGIVLGTVGNIVSIYA
jgi:hypothetical protein